MNIGSRQYNSKFCSLLTVIALTILQKCQFIVDGFSLVWDIM